MRLRHLSDPDSLPALDKSFAIERPALGLAPDAPPVRILLLYGSLRARSFSRLAVEEAARLLQFFGAETRIFDPSDLPLPDQVQSDDHPAVKELRALSEWSEGQVWCSPERHGQITSVMKAQIDHLPLEMAGIRPTQGRTLAVMQVSGGSQSFNAVNTLRLLGRWMRMFTIPNQSSIAKAFQEFDAAGRMKPSPYYDRIADVMEELVRFTALVRPHREALTDRYSERKAAGHVIDEATEIEVIDLPPEELAKVPHTPGSLRESLAALEKDHEFLLKGDVFTKDFLEMWISHKRKEHDALRLRPHPYEFFLYYDV